VECAAGPVALSALLNVVAEDRDGAPHARSLSLPLAQKYTKDDNKMAEKGLL
jgi:hypothetical protein